MLDTAAAAEQIDGHGVAVRRLPDGRGAGRLPSRLRPGRGSRPRPGACCWRCATQPILTVTDAARRAAARHDPLHHRLGTGALLHQRGGGGAARPDDQLAAARARRRRDAEALMAQASRASAPGSNAPAAIVAIGRPAAARRHRRDPAERGRLSRPAAAGDARPGRNSRRQRRRRARLRATRWRRARRSTRSASTARCAASASTTSGAVSSPAMAATVPDRPPPSPTVCRRRKMRSPSEVPVMSRGERIGTVVLATDPEPRRARGSPAIS